MVGQETECLTVNVDTAAKMLGIGRQLCYEMVAQGRIPVLRFGRRIRVPKAALLRMINNGEDAQMGGSRGE